MRFSFGIMMHNIQDPLQRSSSVDIAFAAFTPSRLAKITHITLTYRLQGYKTEIASKSSPLG
jgi:hypothetical protein